VAESGRALWSHPVPPVAKQGHPEQGAQHHVQAAAEGLQGGDPTASGQPVPGLRHPHSTEGLLVLRGSLLGANLQQKR